MLKYLIGGSSVSVILLAIYTILNYTEGGAYYRQLNQTTGPLVEQHRCSNQPLTTVTYYVLVAYVIVLLIGVLRYGNGTSSASNIFKETKCIFLGTHIGFLMFVTFGIFILFTTDYSAQIAVRGFGTLIVIVVVIVLLFGPKMRAVYSVPKVGTDGLTDVERQLATQYATTLRERNGKELMLVLNSLVREMRSRVEYGLMSIELSGKAVRSLIDVTRDLTKLIEENAKKPKQPLQPVASSSQSEANKDVNPANNNNNKPVAIELVSNSTPSDPNKDDAGFQE